MDVESFDTYVLMRIWCTDLKVADLPDVAPTPFSSNERRKMRFRDKRRRLYAKTSLPLSVQRVSTFYIKSARLCIDEVLCQELALGDPNALSSNGVY